MGGAEEGSQRRRGRRKGRENCANNTKRWKENSVHGGETRTGRNAVPFVNLPKRNCPRSSRSRPTPETSRALLEKSRYPSKDSQLSSHSITRSLLSSVSVIAVSTKATHREIRSPLYAVRIKQPTKKKRNPLTLAIVASAVEAAIPRRRRVTAGYNANTLFNYSAPTFAINLEIDRGPIAGLA